MATLDLIRSKFATLNSGSQEEITSVSSWVLFHRRSAKQIVETWMQSLRDATGTRKLNLIYLANDVTQQSKARKREEFVNAFSTVFAEKNAKKTSSAGKIGGMLKSSLVPELSKLNLLYHNLTASISSSSLSIGSSFSFYSQLMEIETSPESPLYASKLFQLLESLKLSYSTSKAAIVVREDIIKQLDALLKENNSMLVKENEQLNEIQKKIDHVDDMKQKVEKMIINTLKPSEDENSKVFVEPEKNIPPKDDEIMSCEKSLAFNITDNEKKNNFEILDLETIPVLDYLKNIQNYSSSKDNSSSEVI
ncbi:hypothetical protein PORY_001130 [Pneumocystis oryctolagi]|uniref:Uncharacterized protein n=1 Tax=Pneumocystis oryctolagi TaxID=42067 RepID=A0ACB7CCV2_9ASCO|nr:hypothetical protein PORY_001130 [Pneumocystis oryctolagi]